MSNLVAAVIGFGVTTRGFLFGFGLGVTNFVGLGVIKVLAEVTGYNAATSGYELAKTSSCLLAVADHAKIPFEPLRRFGICKFRSDKKKFETCLIFHFYSRTILLRTAIPEQKSPFIRKPLLNKYF